MYTWLAAHQNGPSGWNTVMDRDSIEEHLLTYNRASFRAASASPCGKGPVLDDLTFSTLSKAGKDLLNGEFPSSWHGPNDLLREFFASFSAPDAIRKSKSIPTSVAEDDVKRGFGKWREATSTSPSGRHLGHYRAIIQDDILLSCLTKFLDIVVQRGISPSRWQNAVNVMLEKDVGCPRINRLRIIHLFEADFNFFLKLLWGHRLVRRAHDFKMINTGQYGSVPGRTATELVMLNQISNDICRTNKFNIIRFDNDASACYDRILVPLGMMAARRCGMADNAIQVHADTLQGMKYKIKTAFGTSEEWYSGKPGEPLFGTGQGSGASPAVWLTLVVVLMNTLDRITRECIQFRSPDAPDHHRRLIDAFVDDTSLAITDTYAPMTPNDMIRKMETIAQNWERLLYYSGGALNLRKCSWSMIYWEWKNGRPIMSCRKDGDGNITLVTKSTGPESQSVIQYNSPTKSTRILGVHLTSTGDFTDQLEVMRKKSDGMANRIKSSRISPENMLTFLRTMYAPAMLYALPAVATDEENLSIVQTLMLTTALQKLGASKTTPTAIRHGPLELGGLNLIDLRTELGICNLKFLRTSIYTGSEAGKLLIMSLKYSQLEAGVSFPLLTKPSVNISYITPTWITSIRQFLYQHNITVNITDTLRIRYSNKMDRCIMDTDVLNRYTPAQQRDINLVRLYIQVVTLSDLSHPDGSTIREHFLLGHRSEGQKIRTHWPRQAEPTASQRRLWKKFIASTYLRYGLKWRNHLGSAAPQHRPQLSDHHTIDVPPLLPHPGLEEKNSLSTYISRLPRWHKRLLSDWTQDATDLQIWRAFRSRQCITIASDGGLKNKMGTHGWKIVAKSGQHLFSGSGPVDGPYDISHSTRSELGGLTAPLLLVSSLAQFWGLHHKCRYRWITDSKAAISKVTFVTSNQYSPRRYPDDVDYVTAITELHRALGGRKLRPTWIKGHQDGDTDYNELSPDAKLNVDVDYLASEHFWSGHGKRPSNTTMHLSEYRITIAINGVIYPTRIDEQIRYHINGSYLKENLKKHYGWNETTWTKIDMASFGRHFKSLAGSKRVQHMKFVHDIQPLGVHKAKMHGLNDASLIKCPCCGEHDETQLHMLQCTRNPAREKALKSLQKACRKSDGNRFLLVIGDILEQWLTRHDYIPNLINRLNPFLRHERYPQEYIAIINKAIAEQTAIGWIDMLRGFLSEQWHQLASCYFAPDEGSGIINRNDGANRVHRILKYIHSFTSAIWTGRNEALHGSDREHEKHRRSAIDLEIAKFHSEADLVLTEDRFYCETSLTRILKGSTANKRRWLLRVKASRQRKLELHAQQPRITKFFHANTQTPKHHEAQLDSGTPSTRRRKSKDTNSMTATNETQHPSPKPITGRNKTTQQLLTKFFRERAPNTGTPEAPASPSPTIPRID